MLLEIDGFLCATGKKDKSLNQLNALAILRHVHVPPEFFLDMCGHRIGSFGFTVSQERLARCAILHPFEPTQNFLPISVRGEAANLRHATPHWNPLPEDLYFRVAIKYVASGRTRSLVTDKNNRSVRVGHHA